MGGNSEMNDKKIFFDTIRKFKEAKKKTEKEELIGICAENSDLVSVLHLLNDKRIATNIGLRKVDKVRQDIQSGEYVPTYPKGKLQNFQELIQFLISSDCTGSQEDVAKVIAYIDQLASNEEEQKILDEVVTKKLKLGVQTKAINRVFSQSYDLPLIFENELMKGEDYRKNRPNLTGEAYALSLKEDGYRVKIIKRNGTVKIYSTSGKEYTGLTEILQAFEQDGYAENKVYEGEILKKHSEAEQNLVKLAQVERGVDDLGALVYVNSYERYRETSSIMLSDGEKLGVEVHLFDVTDYDSYLAGYDKTPYRERRAYLENHVPKNDVVKITHIIETSDTYTEEYIQQCLANLLEKGYEGLMLHKLEAPFERKRTRTIFKLKGSLTGDGEVVDIYEGEGEIAGKLGGIIVTYKNGTIRVGSGFSAKEREEYFQNPEKLIGKVVTYQYTEPSKDQQGNYSTRFARWLHIREDKTVDEVNYDV